MIVDFMGTPVEFPDDMPQDQIERVLAEEYVRVKHGDTSGDPNAADKAVDKLAANMGSVEAGLVGAGRTVDKWLEGASNIYDRITGDDKSQKRRAIREQMKDELYESLSDEHGTATTIGELLPFFVGGGSGVAGNMALGAAQAGLTYDENQGTNAAVGGMLAGVIPGASKLYKGMKRMGRMPATREMLERVGASMDNSNITRRTINQVADEAGFPLTPSERTGNRFLERIESAMQANPFTASAVAGHKEGQIKTINKMLTKAMGVKTRPELTESVLDEAATKISRDFNRLTKGKQMIPDEQFIDDWIMIDDEMVEGLFDSDLAKTALRKLAERVDDGKPISTADYQRMSSQITKKLSTASVDGNDKQILGMVKDALDGLVERQLKGKSLAEFKKVRGNWKAYKYAAEFADGQGGVKAQSMANKLKRKDELGFTRGRNKDPLYDAARISRAYKPAMPAVGPGTAEKLLANSMLFGAGAGGSSLTGGEDPLLTGVGTMIAPHLLAKAYLKGGGSKSLAKMVDASTKGAKNLLLDPRYQALLGRGAVGTYATNQ